MADGKIWNQWNCSYLQASDVVGICDHTQTFPSLSAISHYHIAGQTLKRSEWWKHDWHGEWGRGKQWPENDVSKICIQNCIMTWIRVLSFCFSFREDSVNLTKDLNFFFQSLGSKFSKDCRSVPCLQQDWQRWQQRAAAEQRRSFHYPWDRCLTRRLLEWWREGHCWGYLTKWNCWMEWWTTGHWGCPGSTAVKTEQGKWQFGSLNFHLVYSPPKRKVSEQQQQEVCSGTPSILTATWSSDLPLQELAQRNHAAPAAKHSGSCTGCRAQSITGFQDVFIWAETSPHHC